MQEGQAQGRPPDAFQLPPALQETANRQYDRDVAAVHPQAQHEPLDSAYHEFIQELGNGSTPWGDRYSGDQLMPGPCMHMHPPLAQWVVQLHGGT